MWLELKGVRSGGNQADLVASRSGGIRGDAGILGSSPEVRSPPEDHQQTIQRTDTAENSKPWTV